MSERSRPNQKSEKIKGDEFVFMALGGLGEIGMNTYLYGYGPPNARSWLMVDPVGHGVTRLYFGSAVVPVTNARTGSAGLGTAFVALLGFHKLYTRILLRAASMRLASSTR